MMAKKLLTFLKNIEFVVNTNLLSPETSSSILDSDPDRFEINPQEFLEYANQDIELSNNHGYINAISNVKRSIECQSDIIHFSFGIPYNKLDFPTKIKNLNKMGISPSVILRNINKIRVNLEHFYKIPDRNRVEEAIEIAQLFLDVTTLSLNNFWDGYIIEDKEVIPENEHSDSTRIYNALKVSYEYEKTDKKFTLIYFKKGNIIDKINISVNDGDDYFELIKLSINFAKHYTDLDEKVSERLFQHFLMNLE